MCEINAARNISIYNDTHRKTTTSAHLLTRYTNEQKTSSNSGINILLQTL